MHPTDYDTFRQRFVRLLEAAALAHEAGDLPAVSSGFREMDAELPRNADPRFDKLFLALAFWDCWIDARNHDWQYYPGTEEADWPRLARVIVRDLEQDRDITDSHIVAQFDFRRRVGRRSPWAWLKRILGAAGAD